MSDGGAPAGDGVAVGEGRGAPDVRHPAIWLMRALAPLLALQAKLSSLPTPDSLLAEAV